MSICTNYECEKCSNVTLEITIDTTYFQHNQLQCFKCPQCHMKYYQCRECTSMLMGKKKQIVNHINYHKRKRNEEQDKDADFFGTDKVFDNENAFETEDCFGMESALLESNNTHHCTIAEDSSDMKQSSSPNNIRYASDASTQFFSSHGNKAHCEVTAVV